MLAELEDLRLSTAAEELFGFGRAEVNHHEPLYLYDSAHLIAGVLARYQRGPAKILEGCGLNLVLVRRVTHYFISRSSQRPGRPLMAYTAGFERSRLRADELAIDKRARLVSDVHMIGGAIASGSRIVREVLTQARTTWPVVLRRLDLNPDAVNYVDGSE